MARKTLSEIITGEDELGLLANVKATVSPASISGDVRAKQKLDEINQFIDRHGRVPGIPGDGVKVSPSEKMLQFALNGIRSDLQLAGRLKQYDTHGLLPDQSQEGAPTSLDAIIASDDALLHTSADDIFTFEHAPKPKSKPDRKAERKPCADFADFAPLFEACARDLRDGRRKSREFRMEQEVKAGEFFILNGAMVYVAEVNEPHIRSGKANARLRLIFDNGTESDNLLRSLAAELYKEGTAGRGRRVTSAEPGPLFSDESASAKTANNSVSSMEDVLSGNIYVVRSLSTDPELRKLDGYLFKIGFTTGSVEARLATAKDDPTFLLAPVHPVKSYAAYNINTVKMENLLHRFFGDARLDIEIKDRFGKPCKPREWFLVPLEIVDEAIKRLIDGSIVRYRYDKNSSSIVELKDS